ncbi:preprotein translocase subunit SecE [Chromatiales bacterium (ex Bugula neritina AB1)]|nr:preprotein translocase subunit SecE [Chromatiales bacterium (ex Bugula neritina AB1)]
MVAKADITENPADRMKLIGAAALVIGGMVLFYSFGQFSFLYRVLALLAIFAVAIFIYLQTAHGVRTVGFFRDSRTEVRKVVWPTRAETTQTTVMVMIIVFLVGVFLWLLDWMLSGAFRFITGLGS